MRFEEREPSVRPKLVEKRKSGSCLDRLSTNGNAKPVNIMQESINLWYKRSFTLLVLHESAMFNFIEKSGFYLLRSRVKIVIMSQIA